MWAEGVTLENVAKVWETSQASLSVLEQHIHHQKEASALASIVHIPTRLPQQKQKCYSPAWWIEEATIGGEGVCRVFKNRSPELERDFYCIPLKQPVYFKDNNF